VVVVVAIEEAIVLPAAPAVEAEAEVEGGDVVGIVDIKGPTGTPLKSTWTTYPLSRLFLETTSEIPAAERRLMSLFDIYLVRRSTVQA